MILVILFGSTSAVTAARSKNKAATDGSAPAIDGLANSLHIHLPSALMIVGGGRFG